MNKSVAKQDQVSLVTKTAVRFGVDARKLLPTLKKTAFKEDVSDEQMMALLIVADQYKLNPFTKEIYAFPDKGGIVPVVGIDGWIRIIQSQPDFDGIDFEYADDQVEGEHKDCPVWCKAIIYRKGQSHPTAVTEYFDEVYRPPFKEGMKGPWQTHTKRMLRHKALIQCARVAYGFSGIYDEDEARGIIEGEVIDFDVPTEPSKPTTEKLKEALAPTDEWPEWDDEEPA